MIKYTLKNIKSFTNQYWYINLVQFFEKAAWWIVIIHIPLYIAQKDSPGGLHWEQTTKGIIYFWWILVQNLTPIFFGYIADKIGQKRTLIAGNLLVTISYILLPFAREFWLFMLLIVGVGIGSALIKPSTLGVLSNQLSKKNEAIGWSLYILLLNVAVFTITPLGKYLHSVSWLAIFWGAAAIMLLQLIAILFIENKPKPIESKLIKHQLKELFDGILQKRVLFFILPISGFTMLYMQFYETLPHFIYDWSDTSELVNYLSLGSNMTMNTDLGKMLSFQYLYMINPLLTTIFILIIANQFKNSNKLSITIIGITLVSIGWMITGYSMNGFVLISGIIIYSFGEMSTNPKLTEYMGQISPKDSKSTYMGYLSLSYLIGYSIGALFGGYMYQHYGEKAGLAARYFFEQYGVEVSNKSEAFSKLVNATGLSSRNLTHLLWDTYQPWTTWLPFFIIGLISVIALIYYKNRYSKPIL